MVSYRSTLRKKISLTSKDKGLLLEIKNFCLGKKYDLSVVFIADKLSKKINFKYRGKNYPTNILSFPISNDMGEIFINKNKVEKEYKNFCKSKKDFLYFLLVHGMVHLRGLEHGLEMDKWEEKIKRKFKL